ncbi:MAG TPA: hypothetical protein VGF34_11745 [Stellaceae bacterium]|jgi:hypothetical protein
MPIPGFTLAPPPETISGAEAVEMVMEHFENSRCTEADASSYLTEQVRKRKVKLSWTENSPEYPYGRGPSGLFLAGDTFDVGGDSPMYLPGFPGARAADELDWDAGVLRRRVRWPKLTDREGNDIDPASLSETQRQQASSDILSSVSERDPLSNGQSPLRAMEITERELGAAHREYLLKEWVTEELTYPFAVKRASLVAVLDPVRVPLAEAAAIVANHLNVGIETGLDIIVEAAATKRIRVYGTPEHKWQGDRIRARVWRKLGRGEARFSTEPIAGKSAQGSWSDPYVFRADLERLIRELAGEGGATGAEAGPAEPPPQAAAECQRPPEVDASGASHDGKPQVPPGTPALRGNKRKVWEAAQRHGRPDFSKHGDLAAYVRMLARETGVKEATVRNYVTKTAELRSYIEELPEALPPQKG